VLAAHDIRNAVGIVDSALTMLEDSPDTTATMHGMMRRATHRLHLLVKALVDVDQLQRDALPLVQGEARWTHVATSVVEAALPAAATKELSVVARGDGHEILSCDAALVDRMLATLVDHAIGNAPAATVVDVEGTRVAEGRFRIRVAYRGRAVGADTLDKYFTTLPLRFCRLAAIRHGGTLRAVSPAVDDGGLAFVLEIAA
jgi:K+-sensing histidine kinase KdpD